jgi:hypothetical protein
MPMPDPAQKRNRSNVRKQIIELIDRMPEEMQFKLLKFLDAKLPRRMKTNLIVEKRWELRKHCLINVAYVLQDRTYQGFILDISAFGVFIESDVSVIIGDTAQFSFLLPQSPNPFNLRGTIVWGGSQGFGVKFGSLPGEQMELIRSFAEERAEVYNIVS